MTKVDFYIAGSNSNNGSNMTEPNSALLLACRLTEKAWLKQHNIYIHTDSAATRDIMDEMLWNFRSNSFIPHRREGTDEKAPDNIPDILIANSGNPGTHHDVLINLSEETPSFFGGFQRIAEIVAADEKAKTKSRERYKYYRKRGFPLQVHNL